jgi:hypothetical protein
VESVIDDAVTAPVVSAGPTASAHLPTARSLAEAVVRWVKVVEDVRVTTTLDAAEVRGFFSLMVTDDPLTAVTDPDATPKFPPPKPAPPGRRAPDPPAGKPSPVPPLVPPLPAPPPRGKAPPAPPAPPTPPAPPNPVAQLPETGWVMVTVVAVTGSPKARVVDDDEEELDVGLPKAEMHEPTVTSAAVADTVCSNVVVDV